MWHVLTKPGYHGMIETKRCVLGDNTDHAGPEIPVNSRIAWLFSRQIAIGNAGPATALGSMGGKRSFRCNSLNIALMYKQ